MGILVGVDLKSDGPNPRCKRDGMVHARHSAKERGGCAPMSGVRAALVEARKTCQALAGASQLMDGGRSRRLRRELCILPSGDFRQCIVAMVEIIGSFDGGT